MEAAADLPVAKRDHAALAAAGVTVLLWGSAFVGIRSAGRHFSPGALSLGRLTVAVAALAVIGLVRGERLPSRDALREVGIPLLICGLLWFGAYNVALN
ncbi:MAG: EamA family transporter, partial [Gaiellaceae bacterium]